LVAIKVLPPDKVANPERERRFIQEARAASALNHPNIVTVHDISSEDGTAFIVMEYLPGKTLDQLIPRKGVRTVSPPARLHSTRPQRIRSHADRQFPLTRKTLQPTDFLSYT